MKRGIINFLLAFFSFVFQCTVCKAIALGGVGPDLPLILTVSIGFMRGRKEGMLIGLLCGLFRDILYGNGLLGLYALIFVYIGYFAGIFNKLFFAKDLKFPVFLIGLSDLSYGFILYVLTFLLRRRLDFTYYLLHIILPETVYTSILGIAVYGLLMKLEKKLENDRDKAIKIQESEES
ncbi:MAG: rod shape-determining protein MreD [Lachnospiraceae bacterium]|nr:rod shape-determining protein MreD [Lachnospiraceae bacterium]